MEKKNNEPLKANGLVTELLRIFLKQIEKQGFPVLMSLALASLFWWQWERERLERKHEIGEVRVQMYTKIETLEKELEACKEQNRNLERTLFFQSEPFTTKKKSSK